MNKLQLGSGPDTQNAKRYGWTTLEGDPAMRPDYAAIVPPLPDGVKAQQWDVIEMVHFIEHLNINNARILLKECYQILAPGGKLITEQPNIKKAARWLLDMDEKPNKKDILFYDMYAFYGDQRDRLELYAHRWGYWPESLIQECLDAGFDEAVEKQARFHWPDRDFRIEAFKHA